MKKVWIWIIVIVAVLAVGILAISSCTTVESGDLGVLSVYGKVSDTVVQPGLHIKIPLANVIKITVKEQKVQLATSAFSKDIQQVDVKLSVNYSVNKANVVNMYKDVGVGYYDVLVLPRILESVKGAFSRYSAEQLVAERSKLSDDFRSALTAAVNDKYITIIQVSIEDIDFTNAYTDAVEAKQVAEQTKLRIQTEKETEVLTAEAEAEKTRINAEAQALRVKLEAEAEAEATLVIAKAQAEANKLLSESLTAQLLQLDDYKAWDGKLPTYYGGDGNFLIQMPE
jgi:regulator of protease activity HflC (stomatin/prohibitin superfamily)